MQHGALGLLVSFTFYAVPRPLPRFFFLHLTLFFFFPSDLSFQTTDWGDHGHTQPLCISYPGLLAAAGYAWNTQPLVSRLHSPWRRKQRRRGAPLCSLWRRFCIELRTGLGPD